MGRGIRMVKYSVYYSEVRNKLLNVYMASDGKNLILEALRNSNGDLGAMSISAEELTHQIISREYKLIGYFNE